MILQSISDVYHVGTLTRESRSPDPSLEAMMLSVSLDPEDWDSIAHCCGPTWVFSNPDARYLDARYLDATSLTDDEIKDIEAWGWTGVLLSRIVFLDKRTQSPSINH